MLPTLQRIKDSCIHLLYPPLCLHCSYPLKDNNLFCPPCQELMAPIDPSSRCPYCFSHEFDPHQEDCCAKCKKNSLEIDKMASVFDYEGPPATLVKYLKYGSLPYLSSGMGAYLAAQYFKLEWPLPDLIVPMPISRLRKWERGFNQSELMAQALSFYLQRPVKMLLKRRSGDFSQAGMNKEQREDLSADVFSFMEGIDIKDKSLLLIDDVMTTGSSLKCCAEKLRSQYPSSIFALTFCRAF